MVRYAAGGSRPPFQALAQSDHIAITWHTDTEDSITGYHLWRADKQNGTYEKVTGFLIPAQGGKTWGGDYAYADFAIVPGQAYWYKLECVGTNSSQFQGPFAVTRGGK